MTKEERQSIILELLIQHNSILVTDLATHLNVSSVTIRKDLTDLEREKKLYRNTESYFDRPLHRQPERQ